MNWEAIEAVGDVGPDRSQREMVAAPPTTHGRGGHAPRQLPNRPNPSSEKGAYRGGAVLWNAMTSLR